MVSAAAVRIAHKNQDAHSHRIGLIEHVVERRDRTSDLLEVSGSWQRCTTELHVDPESRTAPHIVTEGELRLAREMQGKAIAYAREEIDRLYAIVRQEGYVVLLCNTDGIAIYHRGDEAQAEQFKYWGIWVGAVWSEKIEGTNGIGTCITEQRPILVHRDQHFRTRHTGLTCAGAPIFDPNGRLILILDASSMTADKSPTLVLAATKVAARGVEERLFRDHFRNLWTVATAPRFDDSDEGLLLAVDSDLRILGADRLARSRFGLNDEGLNKGVPLQVIFEFDRAAFQNREQDIAARFSRTHTDESWHVLITPPVAGAKGWRSMAEIEMHCRPRISMLRDMPISELELTPASRGGLPPARAHRICEYIHSHLEQNISLEVLAEMAGLSIHHFARAFKQTIGMPPHSYVLQKRIEHAQEMLRTTELPLSEIALHTGFADQSHLARHFRRMTGMSPSTLRWAQR